MRSSKKTKPSYRKFHNFSKTAKNIRPKCSNTSNNSSNTK